LDTNPDSIAVDERTPRDELRREGFTMAFYVAVCLIAALVAVDEHAGIPMLGLIWGTTIGLALAHVFAFRLAARLVGGGRVGRTEGRLAMAQVVGATAVGLVASVPVLISGKPGQADGARLFLSGLIGVAAFEVGRSNGATIAKSGVFAGGVLVAASAVAIVKNLLLGH
jgi:hypothetical protein